MLEEMVKAILKKMIAEEYAYLKAPAILYAKISSVQQLEDDWYMYRITVLDQFGNADVRVPAMPGIRSKKSFQVGTVVTIALPYGSLNPVLLEEIQL